MSDKNRVYVIACDNMTELAIMSADRVDDCVIIGHSSALEEATAFLSRNTADIIIAEINEDSAAISGFLASKKIPYIALCPNAGIGFVQLNKGAAKMIVTQQDSASRPSAYLASSLSQAIKSVIHELKDNDSKRLKIQNPGPFKKIIAIGASTGGSDAVTKIIRNLPPDSPPILIALHMPPVFTKLFADQLNNTSDLSVWEADEGDRLSTGLALVAKGGKHMTLKKDAGGYFVSVFDSAVPVNHKPSVDIFFESVAETAKSAAVGAILTGMGDDGARGITAMRKAGAYTIGQDEKSSIVYGMPKAAYDMGGIVKQASIDDIADLLMDSVK